MVGRGLGRGEVATILATSLLGLSARRPHHLSTAASTRYAVMDTQALSPVPLHLRRLSPLLTAILGYVSAYISLSIQCRGLNALGIRFAERSAQIAPLSLI